MAEGDDYAPAPWAVNHDFTAARQSYDRHAGRSYADAEANSVSASDLVPDAVSTESSCPLLIRCDVTGSMGGWPNTIFSKLPYLDHEVRTEYLGEDAEVSFGAISDTGDSYPLQVRPFSIGETMKEQLEKLVITGGGTGPGNICEAYGLAALYDCRNVQMPNVTRKPPLIIIGDEKPYELISRSEANGYAKVQIEEASLHVDAIYKELMAKFSVYLILKPYGSETLHGDQMNGNTKEVHDRWSSILGPGRIAFLPDSGRVVDVIFGILATDVGRLDYFREEIEGRQKPDQVATVYKSLKTVHASGAPGKKTRSPRGASKLHTPQPAGGRSKKLTDED